MSYTRREWQNEDKDCSWLEDFKIVQTTLGKNRTAGLHGMETSQITIHLFVLDTLLSCIQTESYKALPARGATCCVFELQETKSKARSAPIKEAPQKLFLGTSAVSWNY